METICVKTVNSGTAVLSSTGYDVKLGVNVVSFWVDAWGQTGRAYPVSTSSSTSDGDALVDVPSIVLESGMDDTNEVLTEICFPEFPGWNVHCCSGGKTVAVCLTKG